ncbi:MAG: ABC transporter substrate-binding protein [Candidatus Limnocylindrales bacterium]
MYPARPGPRPVSPWTVLARDRAPAVALLLTLLLAGCGSAATPASAPPVAATGAAPASSFPLTLRDDEGTSVAIPRAPARIVSLAPSITETLFALGEGNRIVGVTSSDDYPPAAKSLPEVASYTGVETEKVVAARPDLVLAWKGITSASDIAQLRSLGYPVIVLYATTLPAVFADIVLVGEATGEVAPADALAARLLAQASAIAAAVSGEPRPRVFYELDATKSIYTPAPDDFTTDMVRRAGGDPITSGVAGVYSISLERLVADDPQVIVLGDANYGTTPAIVAARPGWGGMTAVVDHAVRPLDDTIVTRPGPRIVEGLAALAEAIHPGVALPSLGPAVP